VGPEHADAVVDAMTTILDERMEWPKHQWEHGGPWRLGHGLTVVGPGWWPLVRRGFAVVAETPGATVVGVKQKFGLLELRMRHPDAATQDRLNALAGELTTASRSLCEACGTIVPPVPFGKGVWRNHCPACSARLAELSDDAHAERRLWEERAGCAWPPSEW
jgi:hypothetical protein